MTIGEIIASLRKERGMTQQELAAKVYVTRQAVSRWETGESEPGIDMRKLLALALEVPVMQLLVFGDTQEAAASGPVCQCCGTPFTVPNMPFGHDADGTENTDYCKWCYDQGVFAYDDIDDLAEFNAPYLAKATGLSLEDAVSYMAAYLPSLKRWR